MGYFSIGFVLILIGEKLVKFANDLKKPLHSYMKQPLGPLGTVLVPARGLGNEVIDMALQYSSDGVLIRVGGGH